MWAVDPPTLTAAEAATACAQGIRNKPLKAIVSAAVTAFDSNSATLQTAIRAQQLHTSTRPSFPVPGLTDAELKGLYKGQVARARSKARYIYDHVVTNAKYDLCSYCQHGSVTALDHFIPISLIPELGIDPWNLVPACDRCNKLLLDDFSTMADEQMLHPYALPSCLPPGTRWLHADVHPGPTAAVTFHADLDATVPEDMRTRIINQFDKLKLNDLYTVITAKDLTGACRYLSANFPGGQHEPVAAHLAELSRVGFASDPNDRRGVMFEALAKNNWFTSTGYEAV